jgi:hypothetical protein
MIFLVAFLLLLLIGSQKLQTNIVERTNITFGNKTLEPLSKLQRPWQWMEALLENKSI